MNEISHITDHNIIYNGTQVPKGGKNFAMETLKCHMAYKFYKKFFAMGCHILFYYIAATLSAHPSSTYNMEITAAGL